MFEHNGTGHVLERDCVALLARHGAFEGAGREGFRWGAAARQVLTGKR